MDRPSRIALLALLLAALAGCPIYEEDEDEDCRCPEGQTCLPADAAHDDPRCVPDSACAVPSDCGVNETCGSDHKCHPGDCFYAGCPNGFSCEVVDHGYECVPTGGTGGGGGAGAGGGSGGGGAGGGSPSVVYCGNPDDCAPGETCAPDGTCKAGDCTTVGCIWGFQCVTPPGGTPACEYQDPLGCGSDEDCATFGAGHLCVSGVCTPPADQCWDQGQCPAGDVCASGKCTPSCVTDVDCSDGYACHEPLGICTDVAKPCALTQDCGGADTVCVDGACVPRCGAEGACAAGEVCVDNGCIPDQRASFVCNVEGQQDSCAPGSICLHHGCYISCAPPNEAACTNLPAYNVCKSVTTSTGVYQVCGSDTNLGGECDASAGQGCDAGKVCIDGFCK